MQYIRTYNICQKSLGHFEKIMKNYSFLSFSAITLWMYSLLPKTMLVCSWDAGIVVYKSLSITACTSLKNQHCLGGGGGRMCRPD